MQLQIFIQANIAKGKKLKTCQERLDLLSDRLIKVFLRQPHAQDDHFWVVPELSSYTDLTVDKLLGDILGPLGIPILGTSNLDAQIK